MSDLIEGDDGLPAEEVGPWAKEKHRLLCAYVDISRGVRRQFIGPGRAGATLIDIFCGAGRSRVRKTGEWIDGGCVAAWKKSLEGGAPFSAVYVADIDDERRDTAVTRLLRVGAPVIAVPGNAVEAAEWLVRAISASPESRMATNVRSVYLNALR